MFSASFNRQSLTGMALAATAFALLTFVDVVFKLVAAGHPTCQILAINGGFALLPILTWTMLSGGVKRLQTMRLVPHVARGSASVMSSYAFIYAYSRLPLTDFYTLLFMGPLIVTALSSFWLDEKIDTGRWLAILAGFAGIAFTFDPHVTGSHAWRGALMAGRFAALVGVFCYSLSVIMIRRMRSSETNMTFSFYGYAVSIGISLTVWRFTHHAPPLTMQDVGHLALSGTMAGISSICLMTAYHRSPVAQVAPFQYTQMIWGALASYLMWDEVPRLRLVLGACIVAVSGLFVIYRELRPPEPEEDSALAVAEAVRLNDFRPKT